jgi:hypothetical protein
VRFRERINVDLVNKINQRMVQKSQEETEEEAKKKAHNQKGKKQEKDSIKENSYWMLPVRQEISAIPMIWVY